MSLSCAEEVGNVKASDIMRGWPACTFHPPVLSHYLFFFFRVGTLERPQEGYYWLMHDGGELECSTTASQVKLSVPL